MSQVKAARINNRNKNVAAKQEQRIGNISNRSSLIDSYGENNYNKQRSQNTGKIQLKHY